MAQEPARFSPEFWDSKPFTNFGIVLSDDGPRVLNPAAMELFSDNVTALAEYARDKREHQERPQEPKPRTFFGMQLFGRQPR